MEEMNYAFFVDFDGTITENDFCETMVRRFAKEGWEELNELWEKKEISTLEVAERTFKLFKTTNKEDLLEFSDTITIDPYFKEFVVICKKKKFPIYILSDGYDLYIKHALKREKINLPYYCNRLIFNSHIKVEAPYFSKECSICGVCKKSLIKKLKNDNEKSIYIGDGYSDFCPAKTTDYVFAKTKLYDYLISQGKEAFKIRNFKDVLDIMKDLT